MLLQSRTLWKNEFMDLFLQFRAHISMSRALHFVSRIIFWRTFHE